MNKNIAVLVAAAVLYWLYKNGEAEKSTSAFLNGGDYNEIYNAQWWG